MNALINSYNLINNNIYIFALTEHLLLCITIIKNVFDKSKIRDLLSKSTECVILKLKWNIPLKHPQDQ